MSRPKKPRREFRAFLIDALLRAGASLPSDPSYKELAAEIERVWMQRKAIAPSRKFTMRGSWRA